MKRNGTVSYSGLISTVAGVLGGWGIDLNAAGIGIRVIVNQTEVIAGGTIPDLTWTHIAIVRYGNVLTAYIDGTSVDTYDCTGVTFNDNDAGVILGALVVDTPSYPYTGWLDEIRISKGIARYTSNFTPPTSEFLTSSISLSPSASQSITPSLSQSITPSISISASPSLSISASPSITESISISLSISSSQSLSISSTISVSPSASPSSGYSVYTRGERVSVPDNINDLDILYTEQEEEEVLTRNKVYVGQTGILKYMIHQFKSFVGENTFCTIEWEGRSSLSATESTVYLQIWNYSDEVWETIDTEIYAPQDINFELSAQIPVLADYIDNQVISCRVWQFATE